MSLARARSSQCRRNKSEETGFTCKHGQAECRGNAHDLCLQAYLPLEQWYAAVTCQNFQSPFPGRIGEVDLTRRCVEASKVDWWESGVGDCVEGKGKSQKLGKEARRLFGESVARSESLNVTNSCTVDIGEPGKRRCVVDDGKWVGCDVSGVNRRNGNLTCRTATLRVTLFASSRKSGKSCKTRHAARLHRCTARLGISISSASRCTHVIRLAHRPTQPTRMQRSCSGWL
jgi:hypothetical protein